MRVIFTEIHNNKGPINKKITSSGKSATAAVYDASASTKSMELTDIPTYLENLNSQPEKAIILGIYKDLDSYRITTAGKENPEDGIIARTKKYFKYCNSDQCGLMYFDIDSNSAHGEWSDEEIERFLIKLEKVLTGCFIGPDGKDLKTMCRFIKKSSSSGVVDGNGSPVGNGTHIYFPVKNPTSEIIELIFRWAWLNGFQSHLIDKTGRVHLRSIIDEAVKGPERLVFESDCAVESPFKVIPRECHYIPGGVLDSELAIIALEQEIQEKFAVKSQVYLESIRKSAECLEIKRSYDSEQIKKLVDSGVKKKEARNIVNNRREGILLSSDNIYRDDMSTISVWEILTNREEYDGLDGLRDPLEPEYGKSKAKLFVNDYSVVLNCFAHGGIVYELKFDWEGIKKWAENAHEDELEECYAEYLAQSVLTAGQEAKISKFISQRLSGMTKADIKLDVKEMKKLKDEELASDTGHEFVGKDATHGEMSEAMLYEFGDYRYYGGEIYTFGRTIWKKKSIGSLLGTVASRFSHVQLCKTGSHYNQIVKQILNTAQNRLDHWEDEKGFPCSSYFWLCDSDSIKKVEYTPELGVRFKIGFEPDFELPTPMWDHVLKNVVNVKCYQQAFGLALCGLLNDRLQQAAILKGPGGVGKGTGSRVMQAMLPPGRISAISMGAMNVAERVGGLRDSVVNFIPEVPKRRKGQAPINMEGFKKVTGGDAVTGRNLFRDPFTFFPSTSHFINMNDWPNIDSFGSDIERRLGNFIIEFIHNHDEVIDRIDERIIEHELPGVLAWAINGVRDWFENGYRNKHSKEMFRKWSKSIDSVELFLSDTCSFGHKKKVLRSGLYSAYVEYCREGGLNQKPKSEMYSELERMKNIEVRRMKGRHYLCGVEIGA